MPHVRLAAIALAATGISLVGCGSSKPSSNPAITAASSESSTVHQSNGSAAKADKAGKTGGTAQFIVEGDAICARLNSQLNASPARSTAAFERLLPQAASYEYAAYVALSKVKPPAALAHDWKRIVTGTRKWSEDSTSLAATIGKGNRAQITALFASLRNTHEGLAHIAKRDGFKECSVV